MRSIKPFTLITMVVALAVISCALPSQVSVPPPTEPVPTSTAVPPPTATAPPPTIAPSPTAEPLPISVDTVTRLQILSTFGEGEIPRSLDFAPDGRRLASAGGNTQDFSIRVWSIPEGNLVNTLSGHASIVWTVDFSPDGQMLGSVSADQTSKIWNVSAGTVLQSLAFPGQVVSVRFSPEGQTLAVGGVEQWPDAAIWTYAVASWQPLLKLDAYWNIPAIVFSPDGQVLAGGGTSRNVGVWRALDGTPLFTLAHPGQVASLAISPDGSTLASGLCEASGDAGTCSRGAIWLWDLRTGRLLASLSDFSEWVESVAFSVDGSLLMGRSRDGQIRFYATADRRLVHVVEAPGASGIMALSPDGRLLATTHANGRIDLWQVVP